jgi:hypothetical protein
VAQKDLLGAATAAVCERLQRPVIRRVQELKAKALDWAMHLHGVAMNHLGNPLPGLLGAIGIKFNAVAKHLGAAGDRLKGHSIADAGVDR